MLVDITKNEMILISSLINQFVHKKEDDLTERITPKGVAALRRVEIMMGNITLPTYAYSKEKAKIAITRTVKEFF